MIIAVYYGLNVGRRKLFLCHSLRTEIFRIQRYKGAISRAYRLLEPLARVQIVDREYVPNHIYGDNHIVVFVGRMGL